MFIKQLLTVLISVLTFSSLWAADINISDQFESGSFGTAVPLNKERTNWDINLKNDNNNPNLPTSYRNWWYVLLQNNKPNQLITLHIKNRGWATYYVPVYSYNGTTWYHFTSKEVTLPKSCDLSNGQQSLDPSLCPLTISKRFKHRNVFIARFYPYTTHDLENYLDKIEHQYPGLVKIRVIGYTYTLYKPIYMIYISNPESQSKAHRIVWIHARAHPGETGSSFMLEGMINRVLSDMKNNKHDLGLQFFIVPMQNSEGVQVGNYRTDGRSRNLEVSWYRKPFPCSQLYLASQEYQAPYLSTPIVNLVMNRRMVPLAETVLPYHHDKSPDIIALNLHSANVSGNLDNQINIPAFAYPHFGSSLSQYPGPGEVELWNKQIRFLTALKYYYNNRFYIPDNGGSSFVSKDYPESWWWAVDNDRAVALTIETVYSKAGFNHWVTPKDIRKLGSAAVAAIYDYYTPVKQHTLSVGFQPHYVIPDENQLN